MNELTSQGCEREFHEEERAEVQRDRRFDEGVRYVPRGPEDPLETMSEEFFRAGLDLSNALALLASGELNVAKLEDRLALHRAFGSTENAFSKVRRQFYNLCTEARRNEE